MVRTFSIAGSSSVPLRGPEAHLAGMWRRRIDAEVAQRLAPDAAIRHDDLHLVVGHQLGPEQRQLLDRAEAAADLHLVADPEGPEDQQHDAAARLESVPCKASPTARLPAPMTATRLVVWMPNCDSTASRVTVRIR